MAIGYRWISCSESQPHSTQYPLTHAFQIVDTSTSNCTEHADQGYRCIPRSNCDEELGEIIVNGGAGVFTIGEGCIQKSSFNKNYYQITNKEILSWDEFLR